MLVLVCVLLSVINNALFKLNFHVRDFNRVIYVKITSNILYRRHPLDYEQSGKAIVSREPLWVTEMYCRAK